MIKKTVYKRKKKKEKKRAYRSKRRIYSTLFTLRNPKEDIFVYTKCTLNLNEYNTKMNDLTKTFFLRADRQLITVCENDDRK